MTPDEANTLRLVAAEVIYCLWEDGHITQLELLKSQCGVCIDKLTIKKETENDE